MTSQKPAPAATQLASAERSVDQTATRGSGRTRPDQPSFDDQVATAADKISVAIPTTTTTAVPETTTTTVAPTTTSTVAPTTTTVKRVTTTTTVKRVVPTTTTTTSSPKPVPSDGGVIGDDVWTKLAACESGNRNDGGAPYYGYFQFSPGTWTSLGGTGLPSDHTYDEQKALAIKLQARSGWGQWPVCSKKIGVL